jgi:hypothetical protein
VSTLMDEPRGLDEMHSRCAQRTAIPAVERDVKVNDFVVVVVVDLEVDQLGSIIWAVPLKISAQFGFISGRQFRICKYHT